MVIKNPPILIQEKENVHVCIERFIRAGFSLRHLALKLNMRFFEEKRISNYERFYYMASLIQLLNASYLFIVHIN